MQSQMQLVVGAAIVLMHGLFAAAERVECTADLVIEDHFVDADNRGYMLCAIDAGPRIGTTLMFPAVDPATTDFRTEDKLVLDIAPNMVAAPSTTSNVGMINDVGCTSSACYTPGHTIVTVIDDGKDRRQRRALPSGPRSMIMVRMIYTDAAPDFCDEACMRSVMWSGNQNTDGMFSESSYGKATFPESQGKIVTVQIQKTVASQTNCPFWEMGVDADAAVKAKYGIDTSTYTHRSYYIPKNTPGCFWGGVAYIGCSTTHCKSWIRDANGPVLAHEIGHNLGLQHAGLDADNNGEQDGGLTGEYGDHSGIMGNSALWRGVNAPHRIGLGWMPSASILSVSTSCASKQSVTLSALQRSPGTYSVIKIPRPAGGSYYISHRGALGYDTTMSTAFRSMVTVNYEVNSAKASMYIKGLTNGQSYSSSDGNVQINIVSLSASSAVVSLCGGGGGGGGNPSPPTPPPPSPGTCVDTHVSCNNWQTAGYCTNGAFRSYMSTVCRKACGLCSGGGGNPPPTPPPPPPPPPPTTTPPPSPGNCADTHGSCSEWKSSGYCSATSQYFTYLKEVCKKTCGFCTGGPPSPSPPGPTPAPPPPAPPADCTDKNTKCSEWKAANHCLSSSQYYEYVTDACPASCGTCGGGGGPPSPTPAPPTPNGDCTDNHNTCASWASSGYCLPSSGHYDYVSKTCPKSCTLCAGVTTTQTTTTMATTTQQEAVSITSVSPTLLPLDNPTLKVTATYSTNVVGAKVDIVVEQPGSSQNIALLASGSVVITTQTSQKSGTVTFDLNINVAGLTHNQPLYVRAEVSQAGRQLSQSAIVTIQTAGSGGKCVDQHGSCGYWGGEGHCGLTSRYYEYMRHKCKLTCRLCATQSPIENPPTATTTVDPSQVPTTTPPAPPTPAPPAPANKKTSEKSCAFFNWNTRFNNKDVCGESDEGMGGCSKKLIWNQAQKYCQGFGARMCTRQEFANDVARGTGCGLDKAGKTTSTNMLVWTSDTCTNADNNPGRWLVGGTSKAKVLPVCGILRGADKSMLTKAKIRCCADVFEDEVPAQVSFLVSNAGDAAAAAAAVADAGKQPPADDVYPDNYGDVDAEESEFRMPPLVPPDVLPSATSYDVDADVTKGTDMQTNKGNNDGNGNKSSSAGTSATIAAVVAFVLMIAVIGAVVVVRRKRNADDAAASTTEMHNIDAEAGNKMLTLVRGKARDQKQQQENTGQIELLNESRSSAGVAISQELDAIAAGEGGHHQLSPFSEASFTLDANNSSIRMESTRRENPMCTPDPFMSALGVNATGITALNARNLSAPRMKQPINDNGLESRLRRASVGSISSVTSADAVSPFC